MSRVAKLILIAPLVLAAFALFLALGGEIVKLLWNALVPSIFGWRTIGFREALGLLVLCRILFGGFGLSGSGRSRMRRFDGPTSTARTVSRARYSPQWCSLRRHAARRRLSAARAWSSPSSRRWRRCRCRLVAAGASGSTSPRPADRAWHCSWLRAARSRRELAMCGTVPGKLSTRPPRRCSTAGGSSESRGHGRASRCAPARSTASSGRRERSISSSRPAASTALDRARR